MRVPLANLVGVESRGFEQPMHFFDNTRVHGAHQGVAGAERGLSARERTPLGVALNSFQLTRKKLTEMAVRIESLRGLVYKSPGRSMSGAPITHWRRGPNIRAVKRRSFAPSPRWRSSGDAATSQNSRSGSGIGTPKFWKFHEGNKEAEIMTIGRAL